MNKHKIILLPSRNKMEIIEMNLDHIEYVAGIIMNRWDVSKEYATTEIKRWILNKDNSICFVGIVDGKPMATGVFETISDVDESIPCWNTLLWVEPEHRGKGYGILLSNKRFEYAKTRGYETVYLDTIHAKDYHLKFGWEIINEFDKDGEHYIIMKYDLP
jgi:GNAT superfamily N-acetyltransferase